ncbi:MAG: PIN domain-containing protein [Spirochaetales bacterium]|nr:PIN domain-containing protein [Spirochaetales bacterium]
MTRLFIDSDIILDLLLKRNDYQSTATLMSKIDNHRYEGYTTPLVVANIHYIMTKFGGKKRSIKNIKKLRKILSILTIDEETVDEALLTDAEDFEDAMQFITAKKNHIDFIITRNKKDYKQCGLPVLNSKEFLQIEK